MARKIQVLDESDRLTGEKLKKCVAATMVRRHLADWIVKGQSIRRRAIRSINFAAIPREQTTFVGYSSENPYQHHLEPKVEPFTVDNSEWERYLQGYSHTPIPA